MLTASRSSAALGLLVIAPLGCLDVGSLSTSAVDLGTADLVGADLGADLHDDGAGDLAAPLFGPRTTFSAPGGAYAVAAADVDGDGKVDVILSANIGTAESDLFVFLNAGALTFKPPVRYPIDLTPKNIIAADLNRDGHVDLAVTCWTANSVDVLLNNGDGTFAAAQSYPVGNHPLALAVGDFDRSGALDLAFTQQADNAVGILLNRGSGSFAPAVSFAYPCDLVAHPAGCANLFSLAVADFNRDGRLDLAATNGVSGDVGVFSGRGDGTFALPGRTFTVGRSPYAIVSADFNEDGFADLAVTDNLGAAASVLLGDGAGTFRVGSSVSPLGTSPRWMVGVHLVGKHVDLAAVNGDGTLSVALGRGDGTFDVPPGFAIDSDPFTLGAADFDNDGRLDLVTAHYTPKAFDLLIHTHP